VANRLGHASASEINQQAIGIEVCNDPVRVPSRKGAKTDVYGYSMPAGYESLPIQWIGGVELILPAHNAGQVRVLKVSKERRDGWVRGVKGATR
jgi:hypothetical protein